MDQVLEALHRSTRSNQYAFTEYVKGHKTKPHGSYIVKSITADTIPLIHKTAPQGSLAHSSHFIDKWDDRYIGYYIVVGKDIAGYVIIKKEIAWITAVEVFPAYKGMGFGRILIDLGKSLGGKYLTVASNNPVARELYKKEGFVDMKQNGRVIYMKLEGIPDSPAI